MFIVSFGTLSQTRQPGISARIQHASEITVNNWLVNTSSGELSISHLRLEPLFLFYSHSCLLKSPATHTVEIIKRIRSDTSERIDVKVADVMFSDT